MNQDKSSMDKYIFETSFIIDKLKELVEQGECFKVQTEIDIGMTCIKQSEEYIKWIENCQDCICPITGDLEIAHQIYECLKQVEKQPIQAFNGLIENMNALLNDLQTNKIYRYR